MIGWQIIYVLFGVGVALTLVSEYADDEKYSDKGIFDHIGYGIIMFLIYPAVLGLFLMSKLMEDNKQSSSTQDKTNTK